LLVTPLRASCWQRERRVIRTIGAMSPLDQIRESIEARIAELKNEINALQAARAALHANRAINNTADASTKSAWEPPTKPSKSATPVKVLLAGKLEAMLSETEDGLSAITIAKRSNAGYSRVLDLLRKLESAGQIRRTGSRRTSLWRLITDEERIAERAAELASVSIAKSGGSPGRR
jgi:hypothetical protein